MYVCLNIYYVLYMSYCLSPVTALTARNRAILSFVFYYLTQ